MLDISPGYLRRTGSFLSTGLPNAIDSTCPRRLDALAALRSEREGTNAELYLYDCTTGECFSYNIGFPAARTQTVVVRKPNAGRWVAAVNAAPFPAAAGAFVLDEVVTTGTAVRRTSAVARGPGARWQEASDNTAPPPVAGKTSVLLLELLDAAAERGEAEHPWARSPRFTRDRPVAGRRSRR